jgi:hypothetical protein
MNDAFLVRGGDRLRDLAGDDHRLGRRHGSGLVEQRVERLAVDEFEHEISGVTVRGFEAVNPGDVRMLKRGEELRFAVEAGDPLGSPTTDAWSALIATVRLSLVSRAR